MSSKPQNISNEDWKKISEIRGNYRDPFSNMSDEELAGYEGKMVAICKRTGAILESASSDGELITKMEESGHTDSWTRRHAPSSTSEIIDPYVSPAHE